MNNTDSEYFRLVDLVLSKGRVKKNRTGIDTLGVFGAQARFDLNEGFPLLTTKKVFLKAITHELLWFLSGSTNIKYLVDNDVHIWDEWAYKKYKDTPITSLSDSELVPNDLFFPPPPEGNKPVTHMSQQVFINYIKGDKNFAQKWGELGTGTYGGMWRAFPVLGPQTHFGENARDDAYQGFDVDQIRKVIDKLKNNPDDRRMIVSAWHPYWVDHCALPPCHVLFQFNTEELTKYERCVILAEKFNQKLQPYEKAWTADGLFTQELDFEQFSVPSRRLNCQLYQRSCDLGLGVPFNIASYALLTTMIAQVVNMVPGDFVHSYGDLHIYENHKTALIEQKSRVPFPNLPKIELNKDVKNLFDFKFSDIKLVGYESHPAIKMDVAV